MENLQEKIWFVYVGDHHEGPFSVEEITTKLSQGAIDAESYVWKEGMADWVPMADVEIFRTSTHPEPTTVAGSTMTTNQEVSNSIPIESTLSEPNAPPLQSRTRTEIQPPDEPEPVDDVSISQIGNTLDNVADATPEEVSAIVTGLHEKPPDETNATQPMEPTNTAALVEPPAEAVAESLPSVELPQAEDPIQAQVEATPAKEDPTRTQTGELRTSENPTRSFAAIDEADIPDISTASASVVTAQDAPPTVAEQTASMIGANVTYDPSAVKLEKHPDAESQKLEKPKPMDQLKGFFQKLRAKLSRPKDEKMPSSRGPIPVRLILFLTLLGVGGYTFWSGNAGSPAALLQPVLKAIEPVVSTIAVHVPQLQKWFSPIPSLEDVSPEDNRELKQAAMKPLDKNGPQIAIALSRANLSNPTFYAATNLPDGAKFKIIIDAVTDKLLNHFSAREEARVTVMKKFGKSNQLMFKGAKPLPRGQYMVYVFEDGAQPPEVQASLAKSRPKISLPSSLPQGKKLIGVKSYFLGGKDDATYRDRLKKFHDALRNRASQEVQEVKAFAHTLFEQYNESVKSHDKWYKGRKTRTKTRAWNKFHKKWTKLANEIAVRFRSFAEPELQKGYFYPEVYRFLRTASEQVFQVHQVHNKYFATKRTNKKVYTVEVRNARDRAKAALIELRTGVKMVETVPSYPNGMPKRYSLLVSSSQ